jgi:hypothetical protein
MSSFLERGRGSAIVDAARREAREEDVAAIAQESWLKDVDAWGVDHVFRKLNKMKGGGGGGRGGAGRGRPSGPEGMQCPTQ